MCGSNPHLRSLMAVGVSLLLGSLVPAQEGTWTPRAAMPTPRQGAAAAAVDGILYVIGGSSSHLIQDSGRVVEAYNPKTDTWSTRAPMPTPRGRMAVGVIDGLIHVVGRVWNFDTDRIRGGTFNSRSVQS